MSAQEFGSQLLTSETAKSSVKISCNAKGEAQPEIKVYEDTDADELERIRQLAVGAYLATQRDVRGGLHSVWT